MPKVHWKHRSQGAKSCGMRMDSKGHKKSRKQQPYKEEKLVRSLKVPLREVAKHKE